MRKLRNTLYITTPEAYLAREGECVLVQIPEKSSVRIPAHNLEGIVHFGYPGTSPSALDLCAKSGVCVTFLTPQGRFLARVEGPQSGNVLLRRKQYRISDSPPEAANIASRFVTAKILNSRSILMRGMRDHQEACNDMMAWTCARMKSLAIKLSGVNDLDTIRGIEGEAAKHYFSCINNLLLENKEDFFMTSRNRRPPLDRINCLLSFFYTLLVHECRSACETVGLDPAVGFLHRDRPGRPSLALDLMEELRPIFADRLSLTLVNRRQVNPDDFEFLPNGAVFLKPETKKKLIDAWQKRKSEIIMHPYLQEKIEFGLVPYAQALLLSRYIRGDIDDYPAFIWK